MPHWNEEFLEQYIGTGKIAINVGAHEGHWCRFLSPRFESVIAIEASPASVDVLQSQAIPNVVVYPNAAWVDSGHAMQFNVRANAQMCSALACRDIIRGGETEVINVQTISIDTMNLPACDLIMVDVEGAEVQVLMGATRTIEEFHPDLIVECHEREHRAWMTCWLERAGYNLAAIHEPQRELSDEWGRHVYLVGSFYRPR